MIYGLFLCHSVAFAATTSFNGKSAECKPAHEITQEGTSDPRTPAMALPDKKKIEINRQIMQKTSTETQMLVFYHECGHLDGNKDESSADVYGVLGAYQNGMDAQKVVEDGCAFLGDSPGDAVHPPGKTRCELMRKVAQCLASMGGESQSCLQGAQGSPKLAAGADAQPPSPAASGFGGSGLGVGTGSGSASGLVAAASGAPAGLAALGAGWAMFESGSGSSSPTLPAKAATESAGFSAPASEAPVAAPAASSYQKPAWATVSERELSAPVPGSSRSATPISSTQIGLAKFQPTSVETPQSEEKAGAVGEGQSLAKPVLPEGVVVVENVRQLQIAQRERVKRILASSERSPASDVSLQFGPGVFRIMSLVYAEHCRRRLIPNCAGED